MNTPELGGTFNEGGCTISVVNANIKPGSLWAAVSCPGITSPTTLQSCAIGTASAFVLENCDGT